MRLGDREHAALTGAFARGGEHGADFDRVMAVIVDDHRLAAIERNLADAGEAPPHAAETGETIADHIVVAAHLDCHRDRGERVLDVVAAGHRQEHAFDPAIFLPALADHHVEAIAARPRRAH